MAQLPPDGTWLMQQVGGAVILFQRYTEEEIARFDPGEPASVERAFKAIAESGELSDEQRVFAYFWAGYFGGHAYYPPPEDGGTVSFDPATRQVLLALGDVVHGYSVSSHEETGHAQQVIHESSLAAEAKPMAHFWCGYFWATAGGAG